MRIWRGDYDVRLGHVETSGDGYESLEIEQSGWKWEICKLWVYDLLMEGG